MELLLWFLLQIVAPVAALLVVGWLLVTVSRLYELQQRRAQTERAILGALERIADALQSRGPA